MALKTMLLAATLCAVALAGCTAGDDSGDGSETSSTTTGGVGVGGNVTIGANTTTTSGNMTNTTSPGPNATAPMSQDVTITGNSFVNSTVTIQAGGTVTWTHADGTTAHTVTDDNGSFDSSPNCSPPLTLIGDCMGEGDTFTQTFTEPGTYTYHCKVHSTMTGTVVVTA